jgi:hypothetical protein
MKRKNKEKKNMRCRRRKVNEKEEYKINEGNI